MYSPSLSVSSSSSSSSLSSSVFSCSELFAEEATSESLSVSSSVKRSSSSVLLLLMHNNSSSNGHQHRSTSFSSSQRQSSANSYRSHLLLPTSSSCTLPLTCSSSETLPSPSLTRLNRKRKASHKLQKSLELHNKQQLTMSQDALEQFPSLENLPSATSTAQSSISSISPTFPSIPRQHVEPRYLPEEKITTPPPQLILNNNKTSLQRKTDGNNNNNNNNNNGKELATNQCRHERIESDDVQSLSIISPNSSYSRTTSIVTTSLEPTSPISRESLYKVNATEDSNNKCTNNEINTEKARDTNRVQPLSNRKEIEFSKASVHAEADAANTAMNEELNSITDNKENDNTKDEIIARVLEPATSLHAPLRSVFDALVKYAKDKDACEVAEYLHHLLILYAEFREIKNEDVDDNSNNNNSNNKNNINKKPKINNKELSSSALRRCTDEELFGPLRSYFVNSSEEPHKHAYLCDEYIVNVQDLAALCPHVLFY